MTSNAMSSKIKIHSSDLTRDRTRVIDWLRGAERWYSISFISKMLSIPKPKLKDILDHRCEGFVVRQWDKYKYERIEKVEQPKEVEPVAKVVAVKEEKPTIKQLRITAYLQFLDKGFNDDRARLEAYRKHPDNNTNCKQDF